MKVACFSSHSFEETILAEAGKRHSHEVSFLKSRLTLESVSAAKNHEVVCAFTADDLSSSVLFQLKALGIKLIALRSAGFNHVDLSAAKKFGLKVVRVPEYSPHSVAEHAVALILGLNRKTHKAHQRVKEGNFSLDGLVGFDLHGKTMGVIGTGRIGKALIKIMKGFGCDVLAYDLSPDREFEKESRCIYKTFEEVLQESHIISLHVPLTQETEHMIGADVLKMMRWDAFLINTGRGGLVDTKALLHQLKAGKLGGAGLDVYEKEATVFFEDHSAEVMQDELLLQLLHLPNVLLTGHQGFLTMDALTNIAETTFQNVSDFENHLPLKNEVLEDG